MKLPINTALFFLKTLIKLVNESPGLPPNFVQQAAHYCVFMTCQLTLSTSYLDDLLDLK